LAAGYRMLQQQASHDRPLRAYLLLDAWEGNPLAADLSEQEGRPGFVKFPPE